MGDQFRDFCAYYRRFGVEFAGELWGTWRTEAWPTVLIAALICAVSYKTDTNAVTAFKYVLESCAIYLAGWGIYHLIRTPWKLGQRVGDLAEKVGGDNKVLDLAIEILDFAYQRSAHAPPPPAYPVISHLGGAEFMNSMNEQYQQQTLFNRYHKETLEIHGYKYARKVAEIVESLRVADASDQTMDGRWDYPTDANAIKVIGERLGALADQIPKIKT